VSVDNDLAQFSGSVEVAAFDALRATDLEVVGTVSTDRETLSYDYDDDGLVSGVTVDPEGDAFFYNDTGDRRVYRLSSDQVGLVRLVVDVETGAIAQRIDYTPFGKVEVDTNPGFQPLGFAGGLYTTENLGI
jgi:YD repeat-containing protein